VLSGYIVYSIAADNCRYEKGRLYTVYMGKMAYGS